MDTNKSRKELGFPKRKEDWSKHRAVFDGDKLKIAGHPVMESWESDYMKTLAGIATENGGDVLEVGYGMGIASSHIREASGLGVHTIIEFHPDVLAKCRKDLGKEIANGEVVLLEGFWEDVTKKLASESFMGILFDTYPLHEENIHQNHFDFFPDAFRLLKKGGVFTYYSDEAETYSEKHLGNLRSAGFENIEGMLCNVAPPRDCLYWNNETILAPIVRK